MNRIPLALLAFILFGTALSQPQPYVQLILDASGSMFGDLDSGEPKIDAARRVLTDFVGGLPESGLNIGFRSYGSTTQALDDGACTDSQLTVGMNGVDKDAIFDAVQTVRPSGATPIVYALEQAVTDFQGTPPDATKLIILVTDGEESCGGNLAGAVQMVIDAGIDLQVIGFGLEPAATQAFEAVGAFENAMDALQLATALEETTQVIVPVEQSQVPDRTDLISLVEGDELFGTVITPISVNASFGTIQLDPSTVESIAVDTDGNATVKMLSGDVMSGSIASPIGFYLRAVGANVEIQGDQIGLVIFGATPGVPADLQRFQGLWHSPGIGSTYEITGASVILIAHTDPGGAVNIGREMFRIEKIEGNAIEGIMTYRDLSTGRFSGVLLPNGEIEIMETSRGSRVWRFVTVE